jgi:Fic family protein
MGIEQLMACAAEGLSKATVLRRLEELRAAGLVERTGKARATRYFRSLPGNEPPVRKEPLRYSDTWKTTSPMLREPGVDDPPTHALLEEDPAAVARREQLRALIRRPLPQRPRVGYDRGFLDAYQPNVTYYLPENLRRELLRAGQSDQMARLPAGTYVRSIFNRVLIDLSWNSSRLEGNTYSLLETDRLFAMGSSDPARTLEARMILNHKEAIEFLVDAPDDIGFNRYTILNLHALLAHELLAEHYDEGRLRRIAVGIGGCAYLPLDIPQVIEECFMQILEKAAAILDPLEASFFCMVHLPYLQPFIDVNKRVSRLAANIPLIRGNLAPLTFVDVPARDYTDAILAVYELNRVELLVDVFAKAYRASAGRYGEVRRGLKPPDPLSLAYHEALRGVAREVVQGLMDKTAAAEHIRRWAEEHAAVPERARLVEMAEGSLLSLHEGNFAKFRLRPSEFEAWHRQWTQNP